MYDAQHFKADFNHEWPVFSNIPVDLSSAALTQLEC